jgi:hypothetical protein
MWRINPAKCQRRSGRCSFKHCNLHGEASRGYKIASVNFNLPICALFTLVQITFKFTEYNKEIVFDI